MAAQAGWYPDPEGDVSKLRYWDGTQWTNNYTPNPQAQAAQPAVQEAPIAQAQPQYAQPQYQQPAQNYQQPATASASADYQVFSAEQVYPMTKTDQTLRMIAFIFFAISIGSAVIAGIATMGVGLIALAWVIPMSIRGWKIYKGTKPNTTAFAICTLLFVSIVAGILLLCSTKNTPQG